MLSHWNVAHLLRQLHPWLERERDQVRMRAAFRDLFQSIFDCPGLSNESLLTPYEVAAKVGEEAEQAGGVLASMARIVNDFPMRPVRHLDHVSATPLTCLKRALFLARNYELGGATILFLGDHDLTSLALAQVAPDVAITVVDSDERILETEAILPHFNRYRGAKAIASSAALYLCRPTRRSLPAAQDLTVDPRIYTQGKSAKETTSAVLPARAVDTVEHSLAELAPARVLVVGDGWPTDMTSAMETTSLRGYLRTLYAFQQGTHSPYAGVVAVNLFPHYNAYLVRVLLASVATQLIITVSDDILGSLFNAQRGDPLRTLIESTYQVVARARSNTRQPGVVVLQQVRPMDADGVGSLLRLLIDHPQAKLANAWREGLIAWWTQQGRRLSKKQARRVIERQRLGVIHAHSYLSELSLGDLRALVVEVEQSLAVLEKGNREEEPE